MDSSKGSRNRRVGQAKAIISHKRSLCIECWVMRWSRERSLEPHPCLYLPRPTYPRTQRINGRTTATRIARTSNEEQDYNIITLRGFRERERKINYYIYENACRVYEGGIAVVFTEVGPLERRPRSTKEFVSRESGERKRERENFCPSWSLVCIAPRLYSFDQKWRVRSSLSNESFQVDLVQNLMSLRRYRHTSARMWMLEEYMSVRLNRLIISTSWRYGFEKIRFLDTCY